VGHRGSSQNRKKKEKTFEKKREDKKSTVKKENSQKKKAATGGGKSKGVYSDESDDERDSDTGTAMGGGKKVELDKGEVGGEVKKCFCPGCLKGKACKNKKKKKGGGVEAADKKVESRKEGIKPGVSPGKMCFVCKESGQLSKDQLITLSCLLKIFQKKKFMVDTATL